MEQEMNRSDMEASRRHILKTLGGVIATGLSTATGNRQYQETSSTDNTTHNIYKESKHTSNNTSEYNMNATPAYLTDPGFSLPSLLTNLPYFLNPPDGQTPVILMDTHDYDRLRARTLTEKDNEKIQYLGLAYEELRRREILHLVDYATLYPPDLQRDILRQNQAVVEQISYSEHQSIAVKGIKGLEKYGWGAYQESFRENFGEDATSLTNERKGLKHQRDKMEQGCGDPVEWNHNVLNEYMTALKIRFRANQKLDFEVQGVIGQGDSVLLSKLLNTSPAQRVIENMSENEGLNPRYMIGFDPITASQTREVLDYVSERAAQVEGVQSDDWAFLGSTLAIPKFNNTDGSTPDFDYIQSQMRRREDESLVEEAKKAKSIIERRAADDQSLNQARYEADWAAEQHGLETTPNQHRSLTKGFHRAFNLADYSREIQELADQDAISPPALFIAASALSDPAEQSTNDDLNNRTKDLLAKLGQPSVTEAQLETYRQRGDYLQGETSESAPDWFEDTNRQR
jgi:hypothetical protein